MQIRYLPRQPRSAPIPNWLPLAGWLVGSLFFFYAWVLRVSPSVMINELMAEFAVSGALLGHLSALYFYGYAGMQIPVGVALDRFGPRRLMTCAALLCGAGTLLFALSDSLTGVSLGRLMIGIGAAFSLVGAIAIAGTWFPRERFALLSGFAMLLGMAGGVIGQAPLRVMVEASDWRTTLFVLAGLGVLLAAVIWGVVRDRTRGTGGLSQALRGLSLVARNPQTLLNALVGLGATGPLLGFAGLWGVPYIVELHGVDRTAAAGMTSLTFVGMGLGSPLFGWISDQLGRRRPPLAVGLGTLCVALVLVIYPPWPSVSLTAALCFFIGLGGSAPIVCFAAVREQNPPHLGSTAVGFVNGMMTGAGALFQPLIGWLLDLQTNDASGGVGHYSLAAFQNALSVLLVGGMVAFLVSFFIKESTHPSS